MFEHGLCVKNQVPQGVASDMVPVIKELPSRSTKIYSNSMQNMINATRYINIVLWGGEEAS